MPMKIGITERGDAGINLSWKEKLNKVDGAVLITKNITDKFIKTVLSSTKPLIIHCTCTGWGHSELEPNVPEFKTQLNQLQKLINAGFPAEKCVLRIDPIFPTISGINRVKSVIDTFLEMNTGITRIRISIVDEYKHVRERYAKHGWKPIYNGNFSANTEQNMMVAELIKQYPQIMFETCAEDQLIAFCPNIKAIGCISEYDLRLMQIPYDPNMTKNPQNRYGCHCLSCKTELLTDKHPCPNGCVYCFWKN